MSNAYLVDVGVVVDKDEYPTCYSKVYDETRGYYSAVKRNGRIIESFTETSNN